MGTTDTSSPSCAGFMSGRSFIEWERVDSTVFSSSSAVEVFYFPGVLFSPVGRSGMISGYLGWLTGFCGYCADIAFARFNGIVKFCVFLAARVFVGSLSRYSNSLSIGCASDVRIDRSYIVRMFVRLDGNFVGDASRRVSLESSEGEFSRFGFTF